jgi:hypothetical protein
MNKPRNRLSITSDRTNFRTKQIRLHLQLVHLCNITINIAITTTIKLKLEEKLKTKFR